jgi:hypothetical protein
MVRSNSDIEPAAILQDKRIPGIHIAGKRGVSGFERYCLSSSRIVPRVQTRSQRLRVEVARLLTAMFRNGTLLIFLSLENSRNPTTEDRQDGVNDVRVDRLAQASTAAAA